MSIIIQLFKSKNKSNLSIVTGHKRQMMTDKTKLDRRIVKTRTALRGALLELLQYNSWNIINVRMICGEANIARSSFYLHFENKLALLD